jgi:TolB-like protein/DNA-binding winged helix-turn-helix (wHTH) protein/rhodanese-related sulfurtransferase
MDTLAESAAYRFDVFLLDPRAGALFRLEANGTLVPRPLGSRAFRMLCVLAERRGAFVSKQEMMQAVWPDVVVEENNLTVQMSALRRVLDQGRDASCIQTVPGRGYRLLPEVIDAPVALPDTEMPSAPEPGLGVSSEPTARSALWCTVASRGGALCLGLAALLIAAIASVHRFEPVAPERPRLSVVVLPFQNLSGDPGEEYLADGITEDLTSDLAHVPGAFVIDGSTARKYGSGPADVRQVGQELGVRYAVEGGVRRVGATLQMNVELVSAETGVQVWSDRFDEPFADLADGQDQVLGRLRDGLAISLTDVEAARALRERPTTPDAFDLLMRGRSLTNMPYTRERRAEALALFQQALRLDPGSAVAMARTAQQVLNRKIVDGYWQSLEARDRVETLMNRARSIAPNSEAVLILSGWWQIAEGKCEDSALNIKQSIGMFPNNKNFYYMLDDCDVVLGKVEEAMSLMRKAARISPRDPIIYSNYERTGLDAMLLGHDDEAVAWLERSLAVNPDSPSVSRQRIYRLLAAIHARNGRVSAAQRATAAADRLWPFDTVRGRAPRPGSTPFLVAQMRRLQGDLRLSGERDHADENADFGVPADDVLHATLVGYTPLSAPGATTIHTAELAKLIDEQKPLVLDTLMYSWGRSLPGAVGLVNAGLGGSMTDRAQVRLQRKLHVLMGDDRTKPVVAVGWNSERFDGRNLALRLVAMGYTHVYWYRGGREAWEVAGLPEADLVPADW